MRLLVFVICACLGSTIASAQTTDAGYSDALSPSLASVVRTMHATISRNLAEAAESMPAEEYGFRPVPEVRTFGQVIGHLVNAEYFFCSQVKGETSPSTANAEQLPDKAALETALKASLDYCDVVYAGTTDANVNRAVHIAAGPGMGPPDTVRGAMLMFNTAHDNEHYGNIVVYMRLKGHVPPSTARAHRARR